LRLLEDYYATPSFFQISSTRNQQTAKSLVDLLNALIQFLQALQNKTNL
jgi:hypothetical protein